MGYEDARSIFGRLRTGLESQPEVLRELLSALSVVLNEYHTSVRENRFLVGGAAERLFAIAMRAIGIKDARARGLALDEEDIVVGGTRISLKCSFSTKPVALRLLNSMGSAEAKSWKVGTIFVLASRGIGYADPEFLGSAVRATGDALLLDGKALESHLATRSEWLLRCDVPHRPKDPYSRRAVSEVVVREILLRDKSPTFPFLRRHI